jgi:hypothetical protein
MKDKTKLTRQAELPFTNMGCNSCLQFWNEIQNLQESIAITVDNIIFQACKSSLVVVAKIKLLKLEL